MKKAIVIAAAIAIATVLLLVALNLFGPRIAKSYIEKHSKEMVGRQLKITSLKLNVFTGRVVVVGFKMLEANDKQVFVSFDSLEVRIKLLKLLRKELLVKNVLLVNPQITILQNGSTFNFSDLLKRQKQEKKDTSGKSAFTVSLNNIKLKTGGIYYKDLLINGVWDLKNIDLAIPSVYFGGKSTNIGLEFGFGSGGYFRSKNEYNIKSGRYTLSVAIKDLAIKSMLPYVQQFVRLNQLDGLLSCNLHIDGDANHITHLVATGDASVRQLNLTDHNNKVLVNTDLLDVRLREIDPTNSRFLLDKLTLHGGLINFELLKTGNNFTQAMVPQKASPQPTSSTTLSHNKPLDFRIGTIAVGGLNVSFTDRNLRKPFTYRLSNLSVASTSFAMHKANRIEVKASLPGGGSTAILFNGNVDNLDNVVFNLSITNLDLKYLSPYVEKYAAYPIVDGALSFSSNNTIKNSNINAQNALNIVKVKAGKRMKEVTPEYKIPLRTALYIIQDRHGKASFDVPVTGNIKSPTFSYRKIVIKTLVNLLVKVAVAPIDFLGKELGLKSDIPRTIRFDLDQWNLNTEQHVTLGELAKILKAKPGMVLTLTQHLDTAAAEQYMALQLAKEQYFVHQNHLEGKMLTTDNANNISSMKSDDLGFTAYVDSLTIQTSGNHSAKLLSMFPKATINARIAQLVAMQHSSIADYMVQTLEIPAANLKIITSASTRDAAEAATLITYAIQLVVAGEENE